MLLKRVAPNTLSKDAELPSRHRLLLALQSVFVCSSHLALLQPKVRRERAIANLIEFYLYAENANSSIVARFKKSRVAAGRGLA